MITADRTAHSQQALSFERFGADELAMAGAFGAMFDDVLRAAQGNEPWAFNALFEAFARPLLAYVRAQRVEDPDGAVNDVLLRAFRAIATVDGDEDRFRGWLFTIAYNVVIDERRRQSRRPAQTALGTHDRALGDTEHEALAKLAERRVETMLAALAPDQRDVLVLRLLADLSLEQVADVLGKSTGAVKALQHRGLATLRRRFLQEAVSP